jgi:mycothiol synthase
MAVRGSLSTQESTAVARLAAEAAAADGVQPLSEQVLLHVRGGGAESAVNLLLSADGTLAGFAHLDSAGSAELMVGPAFRRQGRGRMLAAALTEAAAGRPLRIWAHGDLPAAGRLAAAAGFTRDRALWQMRRRLDGGPAETAQPGPALPEPALPDGATVRTFVPGRDEQPWLDLNRRAFAEHPEQGSWTADDLGQREGEPWFDPAGFFLAERRGMLAGFHWTKIHPPGETGGQGTAIGEVYVVGVDPSERGTGLGRALTLTGLAYLRGRGLPEVLLYVDESNTAAVRLYESLGFSRYSTDVMYRWQPPR